MTIRERLNQLPTEVLQIRLGSWNDITILLCFYSCFSWPRAEGTVLWNRFTQRKLHLIWARVGSNVIPFWFNIEEMSQRDMLLVFWDLYLSIIFERLIQEKNPTQRLGGGKHGLRVIAIKIREALREMTGHSMLFFFFPSETRQIRVTWFIYHWGVQLCQFLRTCAFTYVFL